MKPIRTWIVLADGARARILLNEGPGKGVTPVLSRKDKAARKLTRDLGADRPGRVFDSGGQGRHAMEPRVDWQEFEKARFAKDLSDVLDRAALKKSFDRLVLVAPPTALGNLRASLNDQTKRMVTGEIPKDLTKTPDHELASFLADSIVL